VKKEDSSKKPRGKKGAAVEEDTRWKWYGYAALLSAVVLFFFQTTTTITTLILLFLLDMSFKPVTTGKN